MDRVFFYLFLLVTILISACQKREYYLVEVDNPPYKPNIEFKSSEDISSLKFTHLIEKYQLDTIFHGETNEFERILLLRNWIKSVIKVDDYGEPYPGDGYVERILDEALKGQGFHCGHFMKVQNAIMNAYGYVTRTLGAGPGVKGGPDGHHGINEIWLNEYNKWFLSDAKYDHHFEKNGIPLSALEVRDEYLKNKAEDIVMAVGTERVPIDFDAEFERRKDEYAQTYTWVEWHVNNDIYTVWPDHQELLMMYEDDFLKNNIWNWGGNPHWAYAHPEYIIKVKEREAIEWTPNTIKSDVHINENMVTVNLISDTPNFKQYQVKILPSESWEKVDRKSVFYLKEKKHEFIFRTMNQVGITGPEHRVLIYSK